MSIRRSVVLGYLSNAYVTGLGILIVPAYLRLLGQEAYGLIGFFGLLVTLFQLLDMGLSATLSRECARYIGGASSAGDLAALARALEFVFAGIALLAGGGLLLASGWLAETWLVVDPAALHTAKQALLLLACTVPLRWLSGLYRSAIAGFERLGWLAGFNSAVATIRFLGVIVFLLAVDGTVVAFFAFQLTTAAAEMIALMWMARRLIPREMADRHAGWYAPLKRTFGFSGPLAVATIAWMAVSQADKMLLSGLLPLADYGEFTLATVVAGSVSLVAAPLAQALQPRLSRLQAEGAQTSMLDLYANMTQATCVIALPVALTLAAMPAQVLYAWTGDSGLADAAAPLLRLYAIGNGVLAVSALPYFLLHAQGRLTLHTVGSLALAVLYIPALAFASRSGGAAGAGCAWLGATVVFAVCWTPISHRQIAAGLHTRWLLRDVTPTMAAPIAVVGIAFVADLGPTSRIGTGLLCIGLYLAATAAAAMASPFVRGIALRQLRGAPRHA